MFNCHILWCMSVHLRVDLCELLIYVYVCVKIAISQYSTVTGVKWLSTSAITLYSSSYFFSV